jgi:hypothetical protein
MASPQPSIDLPIPPLRAFGKEVALCELARKATICEAHRNHRRYRCRARASGKGSFQAMAPKGHIRPSLRPKIQFAHAARALRPCYAPLTRQPDSI